MENENVQAQDSNAQEEVVLETTEDTEDSQAETSEESVEEVKARLAKAEELAKNYKIRAEKAEKLVKPNVVKQEVKQESPISMTTRDYIALSNAKINEDDIPDIEEFAKFKKISIADALKSNVVKTILSEKEEMRKTANATNTGNARKSQMKVSGEALIEKARRGEEIDDIDALVQARFEAKKNQK